LKGLGESCGECFSESGFCGTCQDGLACKCIGDCANPMIADAPATCVESTATTTFKAMSQSDEKQCKSWCSTAQKAWSTKCTWLKCGGCPECNSLRSTTTTGSGVDNRCRSWCYTVAKDWSAKCTWRKCGGCAECSRYQSTTTKGSGDQATCKSWCATAQTSWSTKCTWPNCAGCSACSKSLPTTALV
jgi:hypothetical protein